MALDVRRTDDGGLEVVTAVDGAYVPLVKLDGDRVSSLVENAKNRGDVAKGRSKGKSDDDAGKEG